MLYFKAVWSSITDRELFIETGLINKLDVGDSVMVDKGFTVADLLQVQGMTLNIPPRNNSDQFTQEEQVETRRIASLRIHVERAIGRIKAFHILQLMPNNVATLSSEIFYVCAFLTTFQAPLVNNK